MKKTFHITARTYNNLFFKEPKELVWADYLNKFKFNPSDIDILCFVLMSNHHHLLIKSSTKELEKFIYHFKLKYFGDHNIEVIRSRRYLLHSYRYIYQNPIRAQLVSKVQDYPFSSIYYLSRGINLDFPLCDKFGIADEYKLYWLNQPINTDKTVF